MWTVWKHPVLRWIIFAVSIFATLAFVLASE